METIDIFASFNNMVNIKNKVTAPAWIQSTNGAHDDFFCQPIDNNKDNNHHSGTNISSPSSDIIEVQELPPCPCCNRKPQAEGRQTLNEPSQEHVQANKSLLDNALDEDDEEPDVLPGVLDTGYKVRKILVEGWVHKKGTGLDFFGSRAWKPRFARLVMASVDDAPVDVPVPLLLIFWFPTSSTPTTVITLDGTVVMPNEHSDASMWNHYCFDIVHVKDAEKVTRTFTAPKKARDAWVFCMNQVLLQHSKALSPKPEKVVRKAPFDPDGFQTSRSPPMGPTRTFPKRRPIPRPEVVLVGESLLPDF